MRTGSLCDTLNELLVAAGEHHLMPGLPREFDDGGADALAPAGDEKALCH
jgi:hypothetical protein